MGRLFEIECFTLALPYAAPQLIVFAEENSIPRANRAFSSLSGYGMSPHLGAARTATLTKRRAGFRERCHRRAPRRKQSQRQETGGMRLHSLTVLAKCPDTTWRCGGMRDPAGRTPCPQGIIHFGAISNSSSPPHYWAVTISVEITEPVPLRKE